MDNSFDTARLLELRGLTTAVSEIMEARLRAALATLAPLIQPRAVLGGFTRGGDDNVKGADKAFAELREIYLGLAGTKQYNLPKTLEPPIGIAAATPAIVRTEYAYDATVDGATQRLTVTSPLRWVLTYGEYSPKHLRDLLAQQSDAVGHELQTTVLQFALVHVVMARQTGVVDILAELGFPLSTERNPEFGDLPITCIGAPVSSMRPPDDVMVQSAKLSGSPAFEEVARIADIVGMAAPMREQLMEQARTHAATLLAEAEG